MSVYDANADLIVHVHQTIERLTELWDQVSMDDVTREKRTEAAYTLFYGAMSEIVSNEEEMIKGVSEDIKLGLEEVEATRQELSLPPFPTEKYKPNSIALLKAIGKDIKDLEEERSKIQHRKRQEKFIVQYSECYANLSALYEKCYGTAKMEDYPEVIDLDFDVEALTHKIQNELQHLQKRYESGKDLFDKFAKWRTYFKKQDDIEAELNTDRARKNRGGCLGKILAEQKKTNAMADRLLKELKAACDEVSDPTAKIDELTPYTVAMNLIQERGQQKESAKEFKKVAKANQLLMEARFGTSGSPMKDLKSSAQSVRSTPSRVLLTPSRNVLTSARAPLTPTRTRLPGNPMLTPTRNRFNANFNPIRQ